MEKILAVTFMFMVVVGVAVETLNKVEAKPIVVKISKRRK